jgi:uncharacterized protein (DUF1697 family)
MHLYVAFLRGMNLGKRRIKNPELCEEFEALGFEDVAAFRASGNVVFGVAGRKCSDSKLEAEIEAGLGKGLGYEVPVFVRSLDEVAAIAARKPFSKEKVEASNGKLQVSLLPKKSGAKATKEVLAMASKEDLLALEGRELYWLPSGGLLDSDLDLDAMDARLGASTRRTMGTIKAIAAKYGE